MDLLGEPKGVSQGGREDLDYERIGHVSGYLVINIINFSDYEGSSPRNILLEFL